MTTQSLSLNLRRTFSVVAVAVTLGGGYMVMPVQAFAQAAATVSQVDVQGVERIDPQTVLSYMTIKPGQAWTQESLSDSTKALYATGLFADVSITPKGNGLVVKVVENPLINQIAFEGNDKLKDEELMAEVSSRARNVLTRSTVQSDVDRISELYRRNGRFSVQVEPKVIQLDQNRVNLVFEINEGPVSEIRGIKFVGNTKFSDDALRAEVSSREARWYRFLSTSDRYDPDRLSYDQELLRRFYLKNGYVDFRVVSAVAELTQDKEAFFITVTVEEGERYKVGKVTLDTSALKDANTSALQKDVMLSEGDWYDANLVDKTIDKMTDTLGDMQYAFMAVQPVPTLNNEAKTIDLVFRATETPKVYVERIDIRGNVRTQDKVIRRKFELAEGDAFNRTKLAKSEQSVKDLDYFDTVKVKPVEGSAPDQTVIDVEVQEKSTGEISVGAGFSTAEGPLADFTVRERNLLGRGQDLSFSTTLSGERTEFDVGFTEPYFLDRDLSAGVDAFHTTRDLQKESSYDQQRTGGALRLGYPLGEHLRQSLRYRLESNNLENVKSTASRFIRDQEGERITSAVSQRLVYDNRDSTLFPTTGEIVWLDTEYAGLGGDASYVSGKLGGTYYYPVYDDVVLSVLGETGAITGVGEDVQINERFFLGGNTLRGFKYAGLGPRDSLTDDALGGNLFYRGSVELDFPLGLPEEMGIKGHAFSDFGSLWSLDSTGPEIKDSNSIRASGGLGVSWRSPVGPIRIDVADPFQREDYDEKESFRFSFGTRF